MAKADGIDFLPLGASAGSFVTLAGTGSLAIFANASGGVIKDFTFDLFSPVNTFYSITLGAATLSFDMTTLSIRSQSSNSLDLSGCGTLHETGFDDAPGTFSFSGLSSKGASPQATFS
jgi:hypothetical protein